MTKIFGIKFLIIFSVVALSSYSCLGMDSVTCEKKDSSQKVNTQKLIDGTFDGLEHKIIQKMLNDLYDKKDFDNLVGQIDRLNSFGDQINQSDTLVKLFNSIQEHYRSQNNPLKTCEQLEKAVKKIGIVPVGLKEWARHDLDELYRWTSTSIFGKSLDMTAFCQLYQSILAGDLINNDYYQIGMILYVCPESRKKGVEFLEEYLGQMRNMNPDDEMIISSCSLNFLQDQTSSINHIATLNVSPEKLVDWVRKNYNKLEYFNKGMSYYIYNYIVNNCRTICSFEEYLMKDFLFCKKNYYPSSYLVFASDKDKQFLSTTFKSFPFLELKNLYESFSKENISQKETRPLAFFSLLCLRELINYKKEDNFDITLNILESQMKYSIDQGSESLSIGVNLFEIAYQSHSQRHRFNTAIDTYRLGKMAYKIFKKWENSGKKKIGTFKELYFMKKLRSSKTLFVEALGKNPLRPTLSKIYYYLSLIKCIENNTKEAKEYLDLANFWKDGGQPKKIADLRIQMAKSAFAEKNYPEVLNQYNQIENIAPTRKQVRNFWLLKQIFYSHIAENFKSFDHRVYEKYMLFDYQVNTQGILNNESAVMKLLCLNKLGYKDAVDRLFGSLLEDHRSNTFLLWLFKNAEGKQDNESICLLYKLMKRYGACLDYPISSYLSAQFDLHNFEEVRTEAEAYLSEIVDDYYAILVLPYLIRACSHLNKGEQFERYLEQYIGLAEKSLKMISSQQQDGKINTTAGLVKESNEQILNDIMCDNIPNEFRMNVIEKFLSTSLTISCRRYIQMAHFLSLDNKHQAAYNSISKMISFQNGVKFNIDSASSFYSKESKDFESSHRALKIASLQLLYSLCQLEKWSELDNLEKYLKSRYKIPIKTPKQRKNNREKAKPQDVSRSIQQHLVNSFLKQSGNSLKEAETLIKELNEITLSEWQQLKGLNYKILIEKGKEIFSLCTKDFEILNNLSKENETSPDIVEKAREVYNNFNKNTCLLNQMLTRPLMEVSVLRKKEVHRKLLEENYQINEANFLGGGGSRENYRASRKLREIQDQQKQALIEAKQKLRKQNRALLEKEYQENLPKESVEEETSPDALLVKCNILPTNPNDYSLEDSILLHQILSRKFNLNDRDQETLRIILTGGERTFQITLNDIIKLFLKFEGFTDDAHHGGSHEKVSGMGLTLMPNANGIKKGSYWGQIEEAKEKIIMIIAKTLMVKDLEGEAIHEPL